MGKVAVLPLSAYLRVSRLEKTDMKLEQYREIWFQNISSNDEKYQSMRHTRDSSWQFITWHMERGPKKNGRSSKSKKTPKYCITNCTEPGTDAKGILWFGRQFSSLESWFFLISFVVICCNSSAKIDSAHEPVNSKPYFYTQKGCETSMNSFQKKDDNIVGKLEMLIHSTIKE